MSTEKWSQVKWRRRVRDSHQRLGLSRVQVAALAGVITDQTSGKPRCQIAQTVIAREAGVDVKTAREFLRAATRVGLMCWLGVERKGRGVMDVYDLTMPDPDRPPMLKPEGLVNRQAVNGRKGALAAVAIEEPVEVAVSSSPTEVTAAVPWWKDLPPMELGDGLMARGVLVSRLVEEDVWRFAQAIANGTTDDAEAYANKIPGDALKAIAG